MNETIPGGCYKDAEGDGWHDANGKPVSKENVEKFLELRKKAAEQSAQLEAQLAQQNVTAAQVLSLLANQRAAVAAPKAVEATKVDTDKDDKGKK